jgi:ubiquitin-conjugating enzyme E2 D/E
MALKRLQKEHAENQRDPVPGCTVAPQPEDMFHWIGSIEGPPGSPYESGVFFLDITIPPNYPFKPPHFIFKTRVYHPNISPQGAICVDILKEEWPPAVTIAKAMLCIQSLLNEPNADTPLVPEIGRQYKTDRELYDRTAREWTQSFASGQVSLD